MSYFLPDLPNPLPVPNPSKLLPTDNILSAPVTTTASMLGKLQEHAPVNPTQIVDNAGTVLGKLQEHASLNPGQLVDDAGTVLGKLQEHAPIKPTQLVYSATGVLGKLQESALNPTKLLSIPATVLGQLEQHFLNPTQLLVLLTSLLPLPRLRFLITGAILLLLLAVAGTIVGLIFVTPLIVLSSPIWIPAATVLFVVTIGISSFFAFGVLVVAALWWMHSYFKGLNSSGSDPDRSG